MMGLADCITANPQTSEKSILGMVGLERQIDCVADELGIAADGLVVPPACFWLGFSDHAHTDVFELFVHRGNFFEFFFGRQFKRGWYGMRLGTFIGFTLVLAHDDDFFSALFCSRKFSSQW
jgi:hypothetical protein